MSGLRVRAPLAAVLPDPAEIGPPAPREAGLPEEARLAPLAPMPRIARAAAAPPAPDARALALLDATAIRLADVESLSRSLRPDLAATLGERAGAIAELARELRAYVAERARLDGLRAACRPA